RREPLDSSANVSCEECLVVLDAEQPRFTVWRERDTPESAGEIRDEDTVAATRIDDHILVIHPGARRPLIRIRRVAERERLAHAKCAAAFTRSEEPTSELQSHSDL